MKFTDNQEMLGAAVIEKILTKTIKDVFTYLDIDLDSEDYVKYQAMLDEYYVKTFDTLNTFYEKLPEYNDKECFIKFLEVISIKN